MAKDFSFTIEGLDELAGFLDQFKQRDVVQAARRAINRTVTGVRQKSLDEIRKSYNVKEKTLKTRMRVQNAQGNKISEMEGAVEYSDNPISMINFVKGSKAPLKQKGVPVKRRRKLKAEVKKGKTFIVKGGFIQKAKKGEDKTQVFKGRRGKGFKKQGTRSVASMVRDLGFGDIFTGYAQKRFEKEFYRELQVRAKGIVTSSVYRGRKPKSK